WQGELRTTRNQPIPQVELRAYAPLRRLVEQLAGRVYASPRSQTPVWERTSAKLRFAQGARQSDVPGATEFRGDPFPNRSLGTRRITPSASRVWACAKVAQGRVVLTQESVLQCLESGQPCATAVAQGSRGTGRSRAKPPRPSRTER